MTLFAILTVFHTKKVGSMQGKSGLRMDAHGGKSFAGTGLYAHMTLF